MADSVIQIKLDQVSFEYLKTLMKNLKEDDVRNELLQLFDKLSASIAGYIIKNLLSGQLVYRRTGTLARSIVGRGVLQNGVPAIRVGIFRGPALAYAGVIDQGTRGYNPDSPYDTIRPRNAKALAIPVNDSLTPAGVGRYQGPRNDPRTLIAGPPSRYRDGNSPLENGSLNHTIGALYDVNDVKQKSASQTIADVKAAYLLMLSVDIKPRFYFMTGMMQAVPTLTKAISNFIISRLVKDVEGGGQGKT